MQSISSMRGRFDAGIAGVASWIATARLGESSTVTVQASEQAVEPSAHGSTGSPRSEYRRHPITLSLSKGRLTTNGFKT
jgi:hypothetical protein